MPTKHRNIESSNHRFMRVALDLARRNLGQTWPNPSVGALVVKDGRVLAQGWTARGGRPHAETQALADAGSMAKGATLYVTLEPCAHHGKTPPCAQEIINAGIRRCVIACRDPNPLVDGKGIAQLREAGIEVIEGVCDKKAIGINRGFFSVIEKKRPYIALKIASSADNKISFPPPAGKRWRAAPGEGGAAGNALTPAPLPEGEGIRWITGEQARAYGHLIRSRYDAIATGIGTVLADDPLLTCRLPGLEDRSPVRVVFDRKGRLPKDSQLAKTAERFPLWIITRHPRERGDPGPHAMQLEIPAQGGDDVGEMVRLLTERGITRLLVEAGQQLSSAFLQSGLVDRIYWFRAPVVIGDKGLTMLAENVDMPLWRPVRHIALPPDTLDILECSAA